MTRKRIIAFAAALVAMAGGGSALAIAEAGSAGPSPAPGSPMEYATTTTPAAAVAPATALAQAMQRVPDNPVTSATVSMPPPGAAAPGTNWFYATVKVPGLNSGDDIEPLWIADLIQGAVAEESGTTPDLHDSLAGSTFNVVLPDGTTVSDESGGMGDVARGQSFASPGDAAAITAIDSTLAGYDLDPLSVTILHVLGAAPEVSAETTDPSATVNALGAIKQALFGSPPLYEGYYLRIVNSNEQPLAVASVAYRTGAGRQWVAPAFASATSLGRLHG